MLPEASFGDVSSIISRHPTCSMLSLRLPKFAPKNEFTAHPRRHSFRGIRQEPLATDQGILRQLLIITAEDQGRQMLHVMSSSRESDLGPERFPPEQRIRINHWVKHMETGNSKTYPRRCWNIFHGQNPTS